MQAIANEPAAVVSTRLYALILSSPRLKKMLLPEGLITSPYEILDYHAKLILEDPKGMVAEFQRTQKIKFLQNGVFGVLDHMWGDGVSLTSYQNEAGSLKDSFKDEGKRHVVIGLKRQMGRGEDLQFQVARKAMAQFTGNEEWLETILDHPVKGQLTYSVVFPEDRPCRRAALHAAGLETPLSVLKQANGKTLVRFDIRQPRAGTPYTVHWSW